MLLTFNINKQLICRTDKEIPVAKSENYLYAQFSFSEEWEGIKTAIFNNGVPYSIQLDNDNKCLVPWEVITESGFSVSVFCGERITANVSFVDVIPSGYIEGQTPAPPSPTVYEQIIAELATRLSADDVLAGDNITITKNADGTITISSQGGGSVTVDERTLTDDNGIIKVKDSGIDTAQLKNRSVTNEKIATHTIQGNNLASGVIGYEKLASDMKTLLNNKQNKLTAGAGISISNQNVISATAGITFSVVETLPETGDTQTIYLIANSGSAPNIYDEYIYVNSAWEKIGTTEVDLTNYYTKTETDTLLSGKQNALTAGQNISINNGVISSGIEVIEI